MKFAAIAAVLAVGAGAGSAATSVAGRTDSPAGWARRAIVTMNGAPLIVGPCRFQRLMNSGMVNYRTCDIMRGDTAAMHARCA